MPTYRGRLAPTPTGEMHLGHARTFHAAWRRSVEAEGALVLRIEDLDPLRCRPEYTQQMLDDFAWMGIAWTEGPLYQSQRTAVYVDAWRQLRNAGVIYPSHVSRKELRDAALAPHEDEEGAEPIFPPEWRAPAGAEREHAEPFGVTWRFRVPDGDVVRFSDARRGDQSFEAGRDFGDFVLWRRESPVARWLRDIPPSPLTDHATKNVPAVDFDRVRQVFRILAYISRFRIYLQLKRKSKVTINRHRLSTLVTGQKSAGIFRRYPAQAL